MRRSIPVIVVLVSTLAACTRVKLLPVGQGRPGTVIDVEGFATTDGARHSCDGTATLHGTIDAAPERHAACIAQRHDIMVRARAVTDLNQRAALLATMPDCTALDPARQHAVVFDCRRDGVPREEVVVPVANVRFFVVSETNVVLTVVVVGVLVLAVVAAGFGVAISGTL